MFRSITGRSRASITLTFTVEGMADPRQCPRLAEAIQGVKKNGSRLFQEACKSYRAKLNRLFQRNPREKKTEMIVSTNQNA